MSRPIVIPGTGRSLTRVTTRVRNLERRYIPTNTTILDWCWVINMAAIVGPGDGTTGGAYGKYCDGGSIYSSTAPFTIVTDSTTFGGTTGTIASYNLTAVRCPAGVYLVSGGFDVFADPGSPLTPIGGPWYWKLKTKDATLAWGAEAEVLQSTDTWVLKGSDPTVIPYTFDPNVVPEFLEGTVPITVQDLDNGYGFVSVLVVNFDTAQHLYSNSFLFLQRMTLGLTTDSDHSTAPGPPATPSTTPGAPPQSLPGIQGPATVG